MLVLPCSSPTKTTSWASHSLAMPSDHSRVTSSKAQLCLRGIEMEKPDPVRDSLSSSTYWSTFGYSLLHFRSAGLSLLCLPVWWTWGSKCGFESSGTSCHWPRKQAKHGEALDHRTTADHHLWSHEHKRPGEAMYLSRAPCLTHGDRSGLQQPIVAGFATC